MTDRNVHDLNRRELVRLAVGAVAIAVTTRAEPLPPWGPGIKISLQIPNNYDDDYLTFAKQMGVEYVSIGGRNTSYEYFVSHKRRVEAAGLKIANMGDSSVHNMPQVTLGLPGRDEKIEEYKHYIRNIGRAGIHYTTYAHMGNGIWSSERETTRGGASARAFHQSTAKGYWAGEVFESPLSHGRRFSEEELWDNWEYFSKQVVPVAEDAGVRIGVHPDDPPVPELGGVPRYMFGTFDGYVRAFEIADSPNVGICLCCGTWMEAVPTLARTCSTPSASLPRWTSSGRSTFAMLPARFLTLSRPTSMTAIPI